MKDPNPGPIFACLYPGLCDVARKMGYALAIHGSLVTDMDLVAIPWTDAAVDAATLRKALMDHVGAIGYDELLVQHSSHLTDAQRAQIVAERGPETGTVKPHGRRTWNLYLDLGKKIDLSVMPRNEAVLFEDMIPEHLLPKPESLKDHVEEMTGLDLEAVLHKLDDARRRVSAMCAEGRPPRMSAPADYEQDDDLVICGILDEAKKLTRWLIDPVERCEGCDAPATTSDSEGTSLCDECTGTLEEA